MKTLAHITTALLLIVTNSALAQSPDELEANCYQKAELEYVHHTEILMHVYERAQVSPRDFEKLRSNLILKRDNEFTSCNSQILVEMQQNVDHQLEAAMAQEPSATGTRAPASLPRIQPMPYSPIVPSQAQDEPLRRGAYMEVETDNRVQDCNYDQAEEAIYNGERVSIGN